MTLKGKTAVVTGGYRGIGKAIAIKLASMGANVVINDIGAPETADDTVNELKSFGVEAQAVSANVTVEEEVNGMIAKVIEKFGHIDILVNNAGITRDGLLMKMKESDWQSVLDVNLKGVFLCTKAVVRPMMQQKGGSIVNITSVVGITGNAGQANYSASKAGVIGFTKSIAKEIGSKGVRVNAVAPGFINTKMTEALPEEVKKAYMANIPLKRYGEPEEIAEVVAFLCEDRSRYMTGQVLKVDGGMAL
ncbi:MAG TPA: 3-oxoacyl-[acyl-carrier-protein] reductase [bacterium]|jgi:3-oxoacyl-[acyl-carrier protein] reductase|nr:3-oxoacyl-[acyl-carrier-protein] reductase [bacterium]HOB70906.1 3-oxoacyl-[acyl-carrier-protein] reductase [bacterium]HPV21018.1 3-oxoacyl-[acyl-carrier-protein] reductase [bacterium]HPY14408.1 3-oxoacyl-[acyl-carrier-protein] reductase [bacterium]HQB09718.1 3-oxoacyl-[acyl-carrier-protein] reductase [bacterium]